MSIQLGAGWNDLDAVFRELSGVFDGESLLEILDEGGKKILEIATPNVPVDTGELRDSGQVIRNGDSILSGFSADHAEYVEYGTSRMAAQPYLRPAGDHQEEIQEAVLQKAHGKIVKVCRD